MGLLLLVRHGQASFGTDDYDRLSDLGWEQARLLGTWLAERGVVADAVVHGGMRRQRETAEAMAEAAGWGAAPEVDPGWAEFDHLAVVAAYPHLPSGELDRRGFQEAFEKATAHWIAAEGEAVPATESYAAFTERVVASLTRAGERAGAGRVVVAVSSGGPIAAASASLVDPDGDAAARARLWQRFNTVVVNSSVTRVVVGSTGPRLLTFNEHVHLPSGSLTYR